ncbi:HET-domain-containing protein, partial [Amniculicola lignicola CBS 123094]
MIPRSIPPRTASRRTIDQAKQWLADCLENHAGCRLSSKGDAKLPTRLIHVSKTRTGLAAHLCHSIDLPADTTYLSLSHCWGTTKFMTTTKANMQDMLISVPIANLSQSFQDAFYILAELGFQYIWIDSLCIVQDDLEDWERESKKMGDVYLSAICNLSASGFENGVHGFLPNLRISDPTPPISTGPLSGRGWVLQEQVLASRTLHFGDEQLSWNCNATSVSETWPLGWRDERYSIDEFALMSKQSLYFVWQHLLNDYCSRAWTKASDRLPALAGIAAQIGRLLGDDDEYLFGLWSGDLMDSLIFFFPTEAPKDLIVLPDWNRAPSWSWAS